MNKYYNDPLTSHFRIKKTKELISRKYHWPSLKKDIEAYIKNRDICLALKVVRYKPYGNLKLMPILTYC